MALASDEYGFPRRYTPIGGGRYPDGTTVNGGRPISWDGNPIKFDQNPARGNGGGIAGLLQPQGYWTQTTTNTHPFQGLQDLLSSSILGRLMSQRGVEGSEIRGLDGGSIAWNHLEDPYGRLTTERNVFNRPAMPIMPPRNRNVGGGGAGEVLTKVLDENGWPVEANPGPWRKNGLRSDGTPMQYTNGQGQNIPNPYI